MVRNKFPLYLKVIIFYFSFLLLQFLYDWLPNTATMILSSINESVYQHMKVAFFASLLTFFIEFLITKNGIQPQKRFLISRLFTTSYLPMTMMVVYLISPLVFGKIESVAGEIIWANIALITTAIISFEIEKHFAKSDPTKFFQAITVFIFLLNLIQYIVFTFELPWFDILATPPGW